MPIDPTTMAEAFVAELREAGAFIDKAMEGQLLAAVESGDEAFLERGFAEVSFQKLPGANGRLAPVVTLGMFPGQPTASGPGARVRSFREILDHVVDRAEAVATAGPEVLEFSRGHARNAIVGEESI